MGHGSMEAWGIGRHGAWGMEAKGMEHGSMGYRKAWGMGKAWGMEAWGMEQGAWGMRKARSN